MLQMSRCLLPTLTLLIADSWQIQRHSALRAGDVMAYAKLAAKGNGRYYGVIPNARHTRANGHCDMLAQGDEPAPKRKKLARGFGNDFRNL